MIGTTARNGARKLGDLRRARARGGRLGLRTGTAATLAASLALLGVAAVVIPAQADETTISQDTYRTGWDQNEPGLTPAAATSSDFGQQFSTALDGQVYAQPLVANNTLIAATENDKVYGLDPTSGAIKWSDNFGPAWPASTINCGDLTPNLGVTSTPVYDPATGYVYLVTKVNDGVDANHPHYYMHAVSPATGAEKPGFPVTIGGSPSNDPTNTFDPMREGQRPGLLLLGGVVYAAFGSHCDYGPYRGYIAGVSTAGVQTALWAAQVGSANNGAGIWAGGGGLVSDGPGRIIFATGNGVSPAASPGNTPPGNLSESVVRLQVNANGSLSAADFFSPSNAPTMDANDTDLGSGGPLALPDSFGTAADPHLMVQMGKDGRLFLLNRDSLGGHDQGAGGGDNVLGVLGPYQGQWGHPAFWGGDGGYVYLVGNGGPLRAFKYGVSGSGVPALTLAGTSSDTFPYTSGSPVVTSTGTTSGSAVVWVVMSSGPGGQNAQLRAYNPVPDANGNLKVLWSGAIGTAVKFTTAATNGGKVYIGTRDGNVIAFGRPASSALTGSPVNVGNVNVGATGTGTLTVTATKALNITSVTTSAPFGVTAPTLPYALASGASVAIPVSFKPTAAGAASGLISVVTDAGTVNFAVSGTGVQAGLSANPTTVGFTDQPVGLATTVNTQVTNTGTSPEIIGASSAPGAPYSVTGIPASGTSVPAGGSFIVSVTYDPTATGTNTGTISIASTSGTLSIPVSGNAIGGSGHLVLSPASVDFGTVPIGTSVTKSFTITNTGNVPVTITKAKAPATDFTSSTPLPEGLVIGPGLTETQSVTFTPSAPGYQNNHYEVTGDANQGAMNEPMTGNAGGTLPAPATDWLVNGAATQTTGAIQLTPATGNQAGSAFYTWPVPTAGLTANFTAQLSGGTGGDGLSFALVDSTKGTNTAVGATGGGLGFSGLPGLSVDLVTSWNSTANSGNFVGIAAGPGSGADNLTYLATAVMPTSLRTGTHAVAVSVVNGVVAVSVDGTKLLNYTPAAGVLPAIAYAGFTAATGASTDIHAVSNLTINAVAPTASGGQALTPTPTAVAFGTVADFNSTTQTVTLTNNGPVTETVTGVTAATGAFSATLPANGTQVGAGSSISVPVTFDPTAAGTVTGSFAVTTTDGTATVTLSGTGQADTSPGSTLPPVTDPSWVRNGAATLTGGQLVLTAAGGGYGSGSSFYSLPVPTAGLSASFTAQIGGGTGGDGLTLAFLDPSQSSTGALGNPGAGLGFAGLGGVAVGLVTAWNGSVGSGNFVGISTSTAGAAGDAAFIASNATIPSLRTGTHNFTVAYSAAGVLSVTMDGTQILSKAVALPPNALVGFTAANGGSDDNHVVTVATIVAGQEPVHSLPAFTDPSWHLNGTATAASGTVTLTQDGQNYAAGSLVSATPINPIGLHATFTEQTAGTHTSTGDGLAFALLDASANQPTALGATGGGLGIAGLTSDFLALCTYPDMGVNSYNFAAVGTAAAGTTSLTSLLSSTSVPAIQGGTHTVDITITPASHIVVLIDGTQYLDRAVTLPAKVLVAFTAGVGASTDTHAVSAPTITYSS